MATENNSEIWKQILQLVILIFDTETNTTGNLLSSVNY